MNQATFECSICGEPSTEICLYCAKDACDNHLCQRCRRCSDCCECEVPLNATSPSRAQTAGEEPQSEELSGLEIVRTC